MNFDYASALTLEHTQLYFSRVPRFSLNFIHYSYFLIMSLELFCYFGDNGVDLPEEKMEKLSSFLMGWLIVETKRTKQNNKYGIYIIRHQRHQKYERQKYLGIVGIKTARQIIRTKLEMWEVGSNFGMERECWFGGKRIK